MQWIVPGRMAALAIVLGACAKEVPVTEVAGECADVFQGQVCTWAHMKGDSVIDAGATIPMASVENAPATADMSWPPAAAAVLKLPAAAAQGTGLTDLTIYWEAEGHPPGPYLTPHFDFHFYTASSDERMAIDCVDRARPTDLPAGYSLPDVPLPPPMAAMTKTDTLFGLCVPQMGMHALLTSELEGSTPFRGTMVVGYDRAQPIFVEPMITKAMLLEKAGFDLPIPSIPGMSRYPHTFHAEYDAQQGAYRFVFTGFSSGM